MIAEDALVALVAAAARVGGCFLVLPGLSSARIPAPARIYLTLAVAAAIALSRGLQAVPIGDALAFARLIASEGAVGLVIGLTLRFLLLSLSFAGTAAATSSARPPSFQM